MKALILSLATVCALMASSTASAGIRVRVGSVGVAIGRPAARPARHACVAPRPARPARPAVVHSRRHAAHEIVEERRDTVQDVVEERQDTVQDVREERVDRVRNRIQNRRHAWALLQNQP